MATLEWGVGVNANSLARGQLGTHPAVWALGLFIGVAAVMADAKGVDLRDALARTGRRVGGMAVREAGVVKTAEVGRAVRVSGTAGTVFCRTRLLA